MRPTKRPLVVGVTGIMGAGKSTVAGVFEELGASRVDADTMGKAMLKDPQLRDEVIAVFGPGVVAASGEIDTAKLGRVAFETPENARKLDSVTREPLIARIRARIEELRPTSDVIVVDAALLPEWGARQWLDILIAVDAEEERSASRLARDARFSAADVRSRMSRQFDRSGKTASADIVIPNYGSLEELKARARAMFWTLMGIDDGARG